MRVRVSKIAALVTFALLIVGSPAYALPALPARTVSSEPAHVQVAAPPDFPFSPWGTVQVNDQYVSEGTPVVAWCTGDGVELHYETGAEIVQGMSGYGLDIVGDDPATGPVEGCDQGGEVRFTVDGHWADQTATWVAASVRVDLTAFRPEPSLDIEKSTNGQDADIAPGLYLSPGDPVTWTYSITNTGNVTLTDILVVDDQEAGLSCSQGTLLPHQGFNCMTGGTALVGAYANVATVSGVYSTTVVSDTDASHYYGAQPEIDLEKHTNGQDADDPPGAELGLDDPVTWTYAITNTGNVTLTSVAVTDDVEGAIGCPRTTLTPGASMTCTAAGTAESGQYSNLSTVTGTPPGGLEAVTDTDRSHYRVQGGLIFVPIVFR